RTARRRRRRLPPAAGQRAPAPARRPRPADGRADRPVGGPVTPSGKVQWVDVEGRRVRLTSLDRVLYPTGMTKAEVIAYYTAVAPALLRQLADRPVTRIRW